MSKKQGSTAPATPARDDSADHAEKLRLATLLSELLMSGKYQLEFPDDVISTKTMERVAKLEARVAELEKAAGKVPANVTERADTAALAKGKGGKK